MLSQAVHPFPGQSGPLTPTPKGVEPRPCDLDSEALQALHVGRYSMVGEVAAHHRLKPSSLDLHGEMASPKQILGISPRMAI